MVPADSRRIPRVLRYSGAVSALTPAFAYRAVTLFGLPFQTVLLTVVNTFADGPTTPAAALLQRRFGLLRVRSPLLAQSFLLSFPPGTGMFRFPGFASALSADAAVACGGLPHSDICGSRDICSFPQLFAACHVLLRLREPRHPSCALLSFLITSPQKPSLSQVVYGQSSFPRFRSGLLLP